MKIKTELFLLFSLFHLAGTGAAEPPSLIQGRAVFERQSAELHTRGAAAVTELGKAYRAALDKAREAATQAGDFEGVMALRAETARFDFDGAFPLPVPEAPASIANLARQHNEQHTRILKGRQGALELLTKNYQAGAAAQRAEMTRQDRLDDAKAFDGEWRRIGAAVEKPALPAPVPVPPPADGETLLASFETDEDLKPLEVRAGPAPKRVGEHATRGAHALQLGSGSHIATYAIRKDWTGHDALEMDVFNAGDKPAQLELLIGDDAWIAAQNYWNRHNGSHPLAPGANTLRIPLAELYRGEPGKRNSQIPRNVDLDQIHFLSFTFTGGQQGASLFVDGLRLTRKPR